MNFFTFFLFLLPTITYSSESCHYSTWDWSTKLKKVVNQGHVVKNYQDLTAEEKGPIPGCTVCLEDQQQIILEGLPPFYLCKLFAGPIKAALQKVQSAKFPIHSILGYRVGKSKGAPSPGGNRTQFSHHSYGLAIDVNAEMNGLYEQCLEFTNSCRLIRGGPYRPESGTTETVTRESILYKELAALSFKWGGEMPGQQKDFMHFSVTGQ